MKKKKKKKKKSFLVAELLKDRMMHTVPDPTTTKKITTRHPQSPPLHQQCNFMMNCLKRPTKKGAFTDLNGKSDERLA